MDLNPESKNTKEPVYERRQSSKRSSLTISVITCLFIGVMGYEIVQAQEKSYLPAKEAEPTFHFNDPSFPQDEHQQHQIKYLTIQSKLQNQKIKELREELYATSKRLHEISLSAIPVKSLAQKIGELKEALAKKEAQNQELLKALDALEDKQRQTEQLSDHLQAELKALSQTHTQQEEQLAQTRIDLHHSQLAIQEQLTVLNQSKDKVNTLQAKLKQSSSSSKQQLSHLFTHIEGELTLAFIFQKQFNELAAHLENKQHEFEQLSLQNDQLEKALYQSTMQASLKSFELESLSAAQQKLQSDLQEEKQQLYASLKESEERFNEVQRLWQTNHLELSALQNRQDMLQAQLNEAELALVARSDELKLALEQKNAANTAGEEFLKRSEELDNLLSQAKQESHLLKQDLEAKNKSLEASNQALQEAESYFTLLNARSLEQNRELEEKDRDWQKALAAQENQKNEFEAILATLRLTLHNTEADLQNIQAQAEQWKSDKEQMQTALVKLQEESQAADLAKQQLENDLANLKTKNEQLEQLAQRSQDVYEKIITENEELSKQKELLQQQLLTQATQLEEMQVEKQTLQDQITLRTNEQKTLLSSLDEQKKQLQDYELSLMQREKETLKRIEEQEAQLHAQHQDVASLRYELEYKNAIIRSNAENAEKFHQSYEFIRQGLVSKIEELTALLDQETQKNERSNRDLQALQSSYDLDKKRLQDLQELLAEQSHHFQQRQVEHDTFINDLVAELEEQKKTLRQIENSHRELFNELDKESSLEL